MTEPQTLINKIWSRHVVSELSDGRTLLHIDRHLVHDGSSRQAFDGLRQRKRGVRNAYVDTFSFQAPEFYRKLGYREFGRLDDFPTGHRRSWLTKAL